MSVLQEIELYKPKLDIAYLLFMYDNRMSVIVKILVFAYQQ